MNSPDIELEESFISDGVLNPKVPNTVEYKGETLVILPKDWKNSLIIKGQIILCFYIFIIIGIADQTVGTLMPTLIEHYSVSQTRITLLLLLQFLGYSVSAFSNEKIHRLFGRRGVMIIGINLMLFEFLINSTVPYLFIYLIIHFSYGLGVGLLDSCMNVLLSSLADHNELMGLLHGFYGFGSILGPPMVSHILERYNKNFGIHYYYLFSMTVLALISIILLFKYETKLKYEYDINELHKEVNDDYRNDEFENVDVYDLLKNKMILLFSFYLLFYVGVETSIGSWLLSYLIHIKNLSQIESSYIVSWFFIGLTIGRMLLGFVTKLFKNEYRANLYYSILSLISFILYSIFTVTIGNFDLLIVKILNIILIVITGIFIGPLFPTSNVTLIKILPPKLHVIGVGIMTSIGCTGSAIIPFIIGFIIEVTSFKFLPLYILFVITLYCFIWVIIPKFSLQMKYDF